MPDLYMFIAAAALHSVIYLRYEISLDTFWSGVEIQASKWSFADTEVLREGVFIDLSIYSGSCTKWIICSVELGVMFNFISLFRYITVLTSFIFCNKYYFMSWNTVT